MNLKPKAGPGYRLTAVLLTLCLVVTLIPDIGHAAGSGEETKISPEEVTEKNVIGKTEDTTTYDLGGGEKMTVFHGGQVRYENDEGSLTDYDRSLVKIDKGEKTEAGSDLDGYSYTNKEGDRKHYMPGRLSEDTPLLMEDGEHSISISPDEKTLDTVSAEGAPVKVIKETTPTLYEDEEKLPVTAKYSSPQSSADFAYESGEEGVKETITLKERPREQYFYIYPPAQGSYSGEKSYRCRHHFLR